MRNIGNNTLVSILIFLIIALLALIGFFIFLLVDLTQTSETEATIYLVDASERMLSTFSDTDISRFEVAQRFLRENVSRLPDNEITSLQVFGSGSNTEDGCLDTEGLVDPAPAIESASAVIQQINTVSPQARDAALVRGAVEALNELANSDLVEQESFNRKVKIVLVTSGEGTCLDDEELIQLTANQANFELEVIEVIIDSDRFDGGGIVLVDTSRTIEIAGEEDITDLQDEFAEASSGNVATVIAELPTAEPPPALTTPTPTPTIFTSTPSPTITPLPSATPIPTSTPTNTPAPPTNTPVPDDGGNGPTTNNDPTATATLPILATPTPGTPVPTPTLAPTATPLPPATTAATLPPAQPTSVPATATSTPNPTNTPTPASGGSGGGSTPTFTPIPTNSPADSPVTIGDITVSENGGSAVVTVERLTTTSRSLSIFFQTEDGTATAPADYQGISGELSWAGSEGGSKTITIFIENDAELEGNETFNVRISNQFGAVIQKSLAVVTIQDDERGEITLSPDSFSVSESTSQTGTGIRLNAPPSAPVTINLSSATPNVCSVSGSVQLTSSNWNNSTINISIDNDNQAVPAAGLELCQITTSAAVSDDTNFAGIDPPDISVTVFDDDAQYVDGTCTTSGGSPVCENGFFFQTIQGALDSPIPSNEIYVLRTPHTENGINVNRNVTIIASDQSNGVIQGAGAPQSAADRLFNIGTVDVTIRGFTLRNGFTSNGDGGAISNQGDLILDNVLFSNNVAGASGGAIFSTGFLDITNDSEFLNNTALNGCGGAIFNSGTLSITNDNSSEPIEMIDNRSSASGGLGGGICNANNGTAALNNMLMSANQAERGGAIYNQGGILNLENSTLAGNRAEGGSGQGGGIFNAGGTLNIQNSTLTGNYANSAGGGIRINNGAIVRVLRSSLNFNISGGTGGAISNEGEVTIENSTLSTNQASADGGALHSQGGALSILSGSTLANNTASSSAGILSNGNITLLNTIVSNPGGQDCTGSLNASFSLILDPNGCTINGANNIVNQSPALNDLSDNGGNSLAHAPADGSLAINNGDPNNCTTVDQWGTSRPQGGQCDIGAIER